MYHLGGSLIIEGYREQLRNKENPFSLWYYLFGNHVKVYKKQIKKIEIVIY